MEEKIEVGGVYIVKAYNTVTKITILEETQTTYYIENLDTKTKYRVLKYDFENKYEVKEKIKSLEDIQKEFWMGLQINVEILDPFTRFRDLGL